MTITFLAISFLMGLFVSAARNNDRSKQFSAAGALAQSKMEILNATPLDQIVTGSDNFTGKFSSYVYNVDIADAGDYDGDGTVDPDMKMITLTVTAPDNKGVATLFALRSSPEPFIGVACHGSDPNLTFMGSHDSSYPYVHGWDYASWDLDPGSLFPFTGAGPYDMPNGGRPGDVAASPTLNSYWAVDYVNNGLRFASQAAGGNWNANLFRPSGLGHATGVCTNTGGDQVWLSDETNHCLWLYTNAPALAGTWSSAIKPGGAIDALGRVRGIACDGTGSEVYVADVDNNCIRHYTGGASGTWSNTHIKNPDNSLNQVNGVAVTRDNSKLFVMDGTTLQWTDPSNPTTWTSVDLHGKLEEDGPQGLTVNDDGTVVWAIAKNGLLFRCDVSDPINPIWDELGP